MAVRTRPAPPTSANDLVVAHLHLVQQVVNQVAAGYPAHVDRGELWNAGALGLVEASRRFDPELSTSFATFAAIRIRGAVIDATRARDWAPRSVRRDARQLRAAADALEGHAGRPATDEELAIAIGVPVAAIAERRARTRSAHVLRLEPTDGTGPSIPDRLEERNSYLLPEESLEQRELVGNLRTAVALLSEPHRGVMTRYYFAGELLRDIAASLGVTEARVSQICAEALVAVRAYFALTYDGIPRVDDAAPGRRRRDAFLRLVTEGTTWRGRLAAADGEPAAALAAIARRSA